MVVCDGGGRGGGGDDRGVCVVWKSSESCRGMSWHVVACRASCHGRGVLCFKLALDSNVKFLCITVLCVSCRGTHRALALLGMLALGYPLLPR